MRVLILFWLGLAVCASVGGCGKPNFKQIADKRVQELLFDKYKKSDAIPFFEKKGKFFDTDETSTVDQTVVLPLLKSIVEVKETEQLVMLHPEKEDTAIALVVKLPSDKSTVDRMARVVQAADDNYDGFIIQQWGEEWLGLALIDKTAYEFLKKSKPNIDKQR